VVQSVVLSRYGQPSRRGRIAYTATLGGRCNFSPLRTNVPDTRADPPRCEARRHPHFRLPNRSEESHVPAYHYRTRPRRDASTIAPTCFCFGRVAWVTERCRAIGRRRSLIHEGENGPYGAALAWRRRRVAGAARRVVQPAAVCLDRAITRPARQSRKRRPKWRRAMLNSRPPHNGRRRSDQRLSLVANVTFPCPRTNIPICLASPVPEAPARPSGGQRGSLRCGRSTGHSIVPGAPAAHGIANPISPCPPLWQ